MELIGHNNAQYYRGCNKVDNIIIGGRLTILHTRVTLKGYSQVPNCTGEVEAVSIFLIFGGQILSFDCGWVAIK